MVGLSVVRLLQNPLGQEASRGERGDIVRVSDGVATLYLDPDEFESATEGQLYAKLAELRRSRTALSHKA